MTCFVSELLTNSNHVSIIFNFKTYSPYVAVTKNSTKRTGDEVGVVQALVSAVIRGECIKRNLAANQ